MTLNVKQKRFVREYRLDQNATQAAQRAGYAKAGASVQGFRLLANPKIKALLEKGYQRDQERYEVTKESIAAQLDEDRALAEKVKAPGAAVSASMGKAKLFGLLVDKQETKIQANIIIEVVRYGEDPPPP